MKKTVIFLLVLILSISFCSCSTPQMDSAQSDDTQEQRLEGYYQMADEENVSFRFVITNIASGEYGGEATNMNDTNRISAWYVIDSVVYVAGREKYFYAGNLLVDLDSAVDSVSFTSDNMLSGSAKINYRWYQFAPDGTISYNNIHGDITGTYVFDGKIVLLYDPYGMVIEHLYVHEGRIFADYLTRV